MDRGHDRDTEIDQSPFVFHSEAAVLRDAAFGNIKLAHDLNARDDGRVVLLGDRLHRLLQDTVDAVFHEYRIVLGLDVNIARPSLQRGEDGGVDEADDRTDVLFRRKTFDRDGLVPGLVLTHDVEGETLGSLIEYTLRLFCLFENLFDLHQRRDFGLHPLVQQQANLVDHHQLARI